jgi:hypothetical protein
MSTPEDRERESRESPRTKYEEDLERESEEGREASERLKRDAPPPPDLDADN